MNNQSTINLTRLKYNWNLTQTFSKTLLNPFKLAADFHIAFNALIASRPDMTIQLVIYLSKQKEYDYSYSNQPYPEFYQILFQRPSISRQTLS